MTERAFFEVVVNVPDVDVSGPIGREDVEDALHTALESADIGEITGAGTGMGRFNLDVEVDQSRIQEAVKLMQRTLQSLSVPEDSWIRGPDSEERHMVYPHRALSEAIPDKSPAGPGQK